MELTRKEDQTRFDDWWKQLDQAQQDQLLAHPGFNADKIKRSLDNWRDAGSNPNVSPFDELRKELLG